MEGTAVLAEDARRFDGQAPATAGANLSSSSESGRTRLKFRHELDATSTRLFADGVNEMSAAMRKSSMILRDIKKVAREKTTKWQRYFKEYGSSIFSPSSIDDGKPEVSGTYDAQSVLSDAFREGASMMLSVPLHPEALRLHPEASRMSPVMESVRIAGVARQLGMDVSSATEQATFDEIRAATQRVLSQT
jgi:hypothetical protein